ncbi:proline dehydrogenase [Subsaximicrobium wynnwilliamsii]|uniref:Proline dehydrogenase n=1 Tax=Subsaximicrobium wynnwilliamsii TaxID=291179 RepID=A0A5C6ZHL4_9FLAO|nr:proline dehydrogenase family protein [Subsaximicrobium wynnwilliamsii]TXD82669.1 proline dehydrogenase [Subsaximicrobium wynnwilliamsii]TXD88404.1 proline dehydrogenase [Subsaximicrobium wynnwilliamsii]TXE02331.1 proline dehydrogenase [Subsaximicrobium wynnwilliamsii]
MEKIFDNTEAALALKSDSELERARFLFELIKRDTLVKIGAAVTKFALKFRLPVEGLIRSTVFDHFCGGITEDDCLPVIDRMFSKNVHAVLDYSVEGKEEEGQFDKAMFKILKTLEYARHNKAIPYIVFKPTGFGRFEIYEKLTAGKKLTQEEQVEWNRIKNRYDRVCGKAFEYDVPILIDGEESWMQDAADELAESMMFKYNKETAIVFNTLQLYRHDRLDYLKELHQQATEGRFKIGMKLVRGAYMEKERERAIRLGYQDPICKDKATTDALFNEVLIYMIKNLENMALFVGTHNEESTYLVLQIMQRCKIAENDKRIWFGQLFGMSDHISYNLANFGYNVAKYLPYGPVRDVMPFLFRRAEENTSVAGQTSRELYLIKNEMKRRKLVKSV